MRHSALTVAALLAMVLSTAAACSLSASTPIPDSTDESFLLVVGTVESEALPGTEVVLYSAGGERSMGTTDALGALAVSRSELAGAAGRVVVFCREGFFCGAWRPSTDEIRGLAEFYIQLAPYAVR